MSCCCHPRSSPRGGAEGSPSTTHVQPLSTQRQPREGEGTRGHPEPAVSTATATKQVLVFLFACLGPTTWHLGPIPSHGPVGFCRVSPRGTSARAFSARQAASVAGSGKPRAGCHPQHWGVRLAATFLKPTLMAHIFEKPESKCLNAAPSSPSLGGSARHPALDTSVSPDRRT